MANSRVLFLCLLLLATAACFATAACECGFNTPQSSASNSSLTFTNALETDFTGIKKPSDIRVWRGQQYNVTAEGGRGQYGKAFTLDNIVACPKGSTKKDGCADNGADGITLNVGSKLWDGAVTSAEMATSPDNMAWGSYRCGMRLSAVNGTCAAFFWFFNDTQEIDIEFLSREFDFENKIYPVNLVIQSMQSLQAGYDAAKSGNFKRVNLTFDPTNGFHEYRFDYLPGKVRFFADSQLLAEMTGAAIPSTAGHLVLQHWSNGNALWSGGPPTEDSPMVVSYVKAYYNSSEADETANWEKKCNKAKVAACVIPDVGSENATTGGLFLSRKNSSTTSARLKLSQGLLIGLSWVFASSVAFF